MSSEKLEVQKEAPLGERVENLQNRVHELLGETGANLDRIPGGEELASTIEGQSKLLKIQESAGRFNQRVLGILTTLNMPAFGALAIKETMAEHMSADWVQSLGSFIDNMGHVDVPALVTASMLIFLRTMKMQNDAHKALDSIKNRS